MSSTTSTSGDLGSLVRQGFDQFEARLSRGPVRYRLELQPGQNDDPITDVAAP
ncbi:MAG: hypothetical protein ACRDT0_16840 [Pseudonocardiaceae bacterium]